MIKALSPHYKIIPFVSPLTGLTSTSFKLQIFVYKGLKTSVPITPIFEITKNNATNTIDDDRINISRLISDAIDFKIQTIEGPTNLIDGKNQAWVKTQVFYTTSDTSELTIPQVVTVDIMAKGYGYGNEGENPSFTNSKILIPVNEYNVHKDSGHFVVPILLDETASSLNAVDDVANILFQDTNIVVLDNDNLGFTPTNVISVTLDAGTPSTAGTLSIEGNLIKYNVGTILSTPVLGTYTIQDSIGTKDTANITLNISTVPVVLTAVDDLFEVDNSATVSLLVLVNDVLGVLPTNITSVDQTSIVGGVITIDGTAQFLIFTPNGTIPAAGNTFFTYTITDDTAASDTATVELRIGTALSGDEFNISVQGDLDPNVACSLEINTSKFFDGQFTSPVVGDTIYNDALFDTIFNGNDLFYKIADDKVIKIQVDGIVRHETLC